MDLDKLIDEVLLKNPDIVSEFKKARKQKSKSLNFLFGQVMRLSNSRAHVGITHEIMNEKFEEKIIADLSKEGELERTNEKK